MNDSPRYPAIVINLHAICIPVSNNDPATLVTSIDTHVELQWTSCPVSSDKCLAWPRTCSLVHMVEKYCPTYLIGLAPSRGHEYHKVRGRLYQVSISVCNPYSSARLTRGLCSICIVGRIHVTAVETGGAAACAAQDDVG